MDAGQTLRGWRKGTAGRRALPNCCLIVPTYRRPETVVALLTRLDELPDLPAEVVIVDGSPEPATGEAVSAWAKERELSFELKYVASPAGLTRQRNVGIDASTKDLVFFLDDDCFPEAGYFRAIRDVFVADSTRAVGAVGGSAINEMGQPLPWRWRLRFALGLAPRGEPGQYYSTAAAVPRCLMAPFTGTRATDILHGATFACRREVFLKHRFSMFFAGYSQGEDLEMALRIGRDWKILWCGDARCRHEQVPAGRPATFKKGRMEIRNRYFIWKRFTPQPSLGCRVRLWLDFLYSFVYDLVSLVAHPRQAGFYFRHALGVAAGALGCLVAPPRYHEPPVHQEFEIAFEELATGR